MFGDMMGMMGKLKETQEKVEATKKRLDTVTIEERATEDLVKVTITANRKVQEIKIDDRLLEDKEELEDYLVITINKAIERATQVNETELAAVAKEGMPNIPGLDSLFGK
ncbi:YbaB/EbfC family nucleoid-associated protein [Pareuzebyella sediminis]|uniref:YbaB/EbfC family nucleoid-associated protein n=1 Tax=Pareuzebyella sediminis TaxID=2607998 RepID=UPI0011ED3AED|nr:YbaB/EbfC family nucleoid-associated protein [Pareuzebyella sediminis]